jgi:beta-glucosidase
LSYAKFQYTNLRLSADSFAGDGSIQATVTLTNNGSYEGTEVVQFYLRDLVGSRTRPVKELKGFELVTLKPGASREVSLKIDKSLLQYYSGNNIWEAEPGDFRIFVGGSSKTALESGFSFRQ